MITKYAKRNIYGTSTKVDKISDDDFDIFFYTVGWESRFAEILNYLGSSFKSNRNIVCSFTHQNKNGYDIECKSKFIEELNLHTSTESELLEFEYSKFNEFEDKINNIIYAELESKQRPLKIGFEISSCPRYYFLSVFSLCIDKNYTRDFSLFYSEGEYLNSEEEDDLNHYFNSYGENTKVIPYSGSTKKLGRTVFVFSLGFESKFIIDEIMQHDPGHVIFLCANPGYTPEYEVNVENEIKRIVGFCELPDEMYTRYNATAGDAISAWQKLEENVIVNQKNAHIAHYVIGTKPHCLAMTLNGLMNDNTSVEYRVAKKYKHRDVKPNGEFWRYDITNLRVI